MRLTLTWDQGREKGRHRDRAVLCGIGVYFAEPHSPWQRPTNENGNSLIRRYVGKGTNLHCYTTADPRAMETRINTMRRHRLRGSTAHDVHTAGVAMTGELGHDRLVEADTAIGGPPQEPSSSSPD